MSDTVKQDQIIFLDGKESAIRALFQKIILDI